MPISRRQFGITLVVSLAMHAALAAWFTYQKPMPTEKKELPPLRLSLFTPIAESAASTVNERQPQTPPPMRKPKPQTKHQPLTKTPPKPVAQQQPPKPPEPPKPSVRKPAVKPAPPVPKPVEPVMKPRPDTAQTSPAVSATNIPPVQQALAAEPPRPVAPNTAPPDNTAAIKYEQLLVAWLEKHKRYPRRAKRLRIEGQGLLRIRLDPTGQTESVKLEESTGNRLLDRATLDMAKRANPFPAMPENMTGLGREFIVPVAFVLR